MLNQTKTILHQMSSSKLVTPFKNMQGKHIIYKLIMK